MDCNLKCITACLRGCTCVPVNSPGGQVVWDICSVCVPVSVRQLLDLQSEVSHGGGARAAGDPLEGESAGFDPGLWNG